MTDGVDTIHHVWRRPAGVNAAARCRRKPGYSHAKALRERDRARQQRHVDLEPYECAVCGRWHLSGPRG